MVGIFPVNGPEIDPFARAQTPCSLNSREHGVVLIVVPATATGDFAQLEDKLAELIGQIFDQAQVRNFKKSEYSSWSSDYRVRKAIRRIRENPIKSLSLSDLAEEVGLSRSQFYTRFKACTGISPGFYLDIMCWERAAESLCRAEQSIGDISEDLGFASQGHFTRFFKAKTGVTPRSFRMGTLPDEWTRMRPLGSRH